MKTKALISFTVNAKLICVFVFAYAKSRFSHYAAHLMFGWVPSSFGGPEQVRGHQDYVDRLEKRLAYVYDTASSEARNSADRQKG